MLGAGLFFAFRQEFPILCLVLLYLNGLSPYYSPRVFWNSQKGIKMDQSDEASPASTQGLIFSFSQHSGIRKDMISMLKKVKVNHILTRMLGTSSKSLLGYVPKWKEFPYCSSFWDFMIYSETIKDLFTSSM